MLHKIAIHRADFEFRADWIDVVCDAFEKAWLTGEVPEIRDYLGKATTEERGELFEQLLLVDVECRRNIGQPRKCEEYVKEYPEFASEIQAVDFTTDINRPKLSNFAEAVSTQKSREPGDWVDQFELVEKIGQGAEGEVWRARDSKLVREVALKFPLFGEGADFQRSLSEGRALGRLKHPHIVRVYDIRRCEDTTYIVSDLVEGGTLRDVIQSGKTDRAFAVQVCIEIALALDHAHEQGIVHRDLKPANVMLDPLGKALITDFGLAKSQQGYDRSAPGKIIGTPAYMSPEQTGRTAGKVDARSDLYSLGVILYELLTERRPFDEAYPEVLDEITHVAPVDPRQVDRSIAPELQSICLKCLKKSPDERYQASYELADDLRRYQRGETVRALPASRLTMLRKWVLRRPIVALSMALALVALIALFVAGTATRRNQELLGLRSVLIETVSRGAAVSMVPLDAATGEPIDSQLIHLKGKTKRKLAPGDYLVIALAADGRFHEVFRRVPKPGDIPGSFNHQRWQETERGEIRLPRIDIPRHRVQNDMVLIETAPDGQSDAGCSAAGFYVDPEEFLVGDLQGVSMVLHRDADKLSPDQPVDATYDMAVAIAEAVGKRLPTKRELACALSVSSSQSADDAAQDSSVPQRQIVNLRDGVAEWTTTSAAASLMGLKSADFETIARQYRVVFGGGSLPKLDAISEADGLCRTVTRYCIASGLGFRCVKSKHPRFVDDESWSR